MAAEAGRCRQSRSHPRRAVRSGPRRAEVDPADGGAPGRGQARHATRGRGVCRAAAGGSDQHAVRHGLLQHGLARTRQGHAGRRRAARALDSHPPCPHRAAADLHADEPAARAGGAAGRRTVAPRATTGRHARGCLGAARARRLAGRRNHEESVRPPAGRLPAGALHDLLTARPAPAGGPGQAAPVAALPVAGNAGRHRAEPRAAADGPRRHHARHHARAATLRPCRRRTWNSISIRACTRAGETSEGVVLVYASPSGSHVHSARHGSRLREPLKTDYRLRFGAAARSADFNCTALFLPSRHARGISALLPAPSSPGEEGEGNSGTARCIAGWSARL